MSGARLTGASADRADFRNADLTQGNLEGGNFENGLMANIKLINSSLLGTFFDEAQMGGADLHGADIGMRLVCKCQSQQFKLCWSCQRHYRVCQVRIIGCSLTQPWDGSSNDKFRYSYAVVQLLLASVDQNTTCTLAIVRVSNSITHPLLYSTIFYFCPPSNSKGAPRVKLLAAAPISAARTSPMPTMKAPTFKPRGWWVPSCPTAGSPALIFGLQTSPMRNLEEPMSRAITRPMSLVSVPLHRHQLVGRQCATLQRPNVAMSSNMSQRTRSQIRR